MKKAVLVLIVVMAAIAIGTRVLGANRATVSAPTVLTFQNPALVFPPYTARSLYSIRRITAPVVDGNLDDWLSDDGVDVNRETAYSFSGRIYNTADLSATIRSGWSSDMLYFAIQVSDDVIVTDSTDVWRDDGVEIGLDGLHDAEAWGPDDHQFTIVADGRAAEHGALTGDVVAAVMTYPGGYNIEVAIPISQLIPGEPISGTVMGFTVGVHDDDDGGNWDAYLIWEGSNTSSLPEQFGSLVLVERPEDRVALLEARIAQLERKIWELLAVLRELERVTAP